MHYAADKIVPVTAELGGKNPNIVMPDADLDLAVAGIVQGMRLFRQGQSCTAGTRIYIHEDVYREVSGERVAETRQGRMGNPLDEATQVGSRSSRASSSHGWSATSQWRARRRGRAS